MSCSPIDGRILSDGRYHAIVTAAGTGVSACGPLALTRWSADPTEDAEGSFVYLRDLAGGRYWSVGSQPVPRASGHCRMGYRHGRVTLLRSDDGIDATLEICVVPDESTELRRLDLVNRSRRERRIEVTTYAEVVLHERAADASHPAFAKLFVQTERVAEVGALLAWRRPRSRTESFPWMFHALHGGGDVDGSVEVETDRARFVGRGHDLRHPRALASSAPLSGTVGKVLDPVFSMRRTVSLAPGARASLVFVLGAVASRDDAIAAASRYRDPDAVHTAFERAAADEARRARRLGLRREACERFQALAVTSLYGRAMPVTSPAARDATRPVAATAKTTTVVNAPSAAQVRATTEAPVAATAPLPVHSELGLAADALLAVVRGDHASAVAAAREAAAAVSYWRQLGIASAWVAVCEESGCSGDGKCALVVAARTGRGSAAPEVSCPCDGVEATWLARLLASAHVIATDGSLRPAASVRCTVASESRVAEGADEPRGPTAEPRASAAPGSDDALRKLPGAPPVSADDSERRAPAEPQRDEELRHFNGYGGFSADGSEYRIRVEPHAEGGRPPLPWINVVANPRFGFLASETGAGYTWSRNSREHRLTPWSNDPVCDPHGEALYLRDDDSGAWWSPLPGPAPAFPDARDAAATSKAPAARASLDAPGTTNLPGVADAAGTTNPSGLADAAGTTNEAGTADVAGSTDAAAGRLDAGDPSYLAAHGFGYTSWQHVSHGLEQRTSMFVAAGDPVKIVRLRVRNTGSEVRRLSVVWYVRLLLGVDPATDSRFVVTEIDDASRAVLATSARSDVFADGIAFVAAAEPVAADVSFTADRAWFVGRHGDLSAPAALVRGGPLDGRSGRGLDPCAAVRLTITVEAGDSVTCAFLLGEATTRAELDELLARYRRPGAVDGALRDACSAWSDLLSAVRVETPSPAVDFAIGGWPLYQAVACRLWGRSAFYQSGGAFGFRDQLQDATALVYARPDLLREQILLHAAHQFVEGDVMHWWHPPADRGMRTRFSDDLLWLPLVAAFYVDVTGDAGVLDERCGYVTARALEPGEDEAYLSVTTAAHAGSLYEHCCLALDRSLTRGAHDLPLMGTGDWNDGMNRVGAGGKGESVWLGFFLHALLRDFAGLCEQRGDVERARRYREHRRRLGIALEEAGWDGAWYRRAYYDDGTPLGSANSEECRIDVLVQAWAVLSGAARPERARRAMQAVEELLVSPDAGLIRLLTPPFDRCKEDPGYIKGYVPGIRENGGQYTHAALWAVRAMAELGRRDRALAWLEMLSPLSHSSTRERADVYEVEPYVVAADVYGVKPHVGRGGWTWYTGSAAWMYRIALESILGFTVESGAIIRLLPCVPDEWPGYRLHYRLPDAVATTYDIDVRNPERCAERVVSATLDGRALPVDGGAADIRLVHDGATHTVEIVLGVARGRRQP